MITPQQNVYFNINELSKITIRASDTEITNLTPFDEAIVLITCNDQSFQITSLTFYEIMQLIQMRISQNKSLDESIDKDIGFLWNEELQGKTNLKYYTKEGIKFWVGMHYMLFSSAPRDPQSIDTWLYLNQDDTIIFEVTPTYPWVLGAKPKTKKEQAQYITYNEFVKSYKPLVKIALSKETAQQWLKQAEEIIKIIETNYQKMKENGEI